MYFCIQDKSPLPAGLVSFSPASILYTVPALWLIVALKSEARKKLKHGKAYTYVLFMKNVAAEHLLIDPFNLRSNIIHS